MGITGIILAAGCGNRLGSLTQDIPKPLLEVAGLPLIAHGLRFLDRLGIGRKIVVGGYKHEKLAEAVSRIAPDAIVLENQDYRAGSLMTLAKALEQVEGDFVVMTADHLFRQDIPERARQQFGPALTIFTDKDRVLGDDDMKVELDAAGKMRKISKTLDAYQVGYVGFSYCPAAALEQVRRAIAETHQSHGPSANVEHAWQWLADQGHDIAIGDISGSKWLEIDFPHEYERAAQELAEHGELY
jgi:choline kinase